MLVCGSIAIGAATVARQRLTAQADHATEVEVEARARISDSASNADAVGTSN